MCYRAEQASDTRCIDCVNSDRRVLNCCTRSAHQVSLSVELLVLLHLSLWHQSVSSLKGRRTVIAYDVF